LTERPLKIGVVGIPGKWSSEALADAVANKTGHRLLIDMAGIDVSLADGSVGFEGHDLCQLDAIIVKKIAEVYSPNILNRIELLRFLGTTGVSIYSHPVAILQLVNRLSCTVTLRAGGIPLPQTVITENLDAAAKAVEKFGQAVLKPLFSTKARGMTVINRDQDGWRQSLQAFANRNSMIYIQKRIDIPGQDLGVMFVGGKYIATYARVGDKDSWNTTIQSGGHYTAHEPSTNVLKIAEKAQALFGLDFTCVDVVETSAGPMVFEVSAFGGFRGLRDAHGIDAAALLSDHVVDAQRAKRRGAS